MTRKETDKILKWGTGLFVVLFSIFLFWLNHLMPLLPGDDYLYQLKFSADGALKSEYINTPIDLLESAVNHYSVYNNRIFPHLILQSVLLLPQWVFAILNTCVFLLLPYLILSGKDAPVNKVSLILYTIVLCILWVFHFDLGRAYFWTTGSLNYSWMLIPQILFLNGVLNWQSRQNQTLDKKYIFLAAVICTSNENVVLSLSLLLTYFIATHLIEKKSTPDKSAFIALIILSLGGLIMLLAPSISLRLENEAAVYDSTMVRFIEYLKRSFIYFLSGTPIFLVLFFSKRQDSLKPNKQQIILIVLYCLAALVMVAAPRYDARSAIYGFMLMVMVLVRYKRFENIRPVAVVFLIGLAVYLSLFRLPMFQSLYQRAQENMSILAQSGTEKDTVFLKPYCLSYKMNKCLICDDLSDDPAHINNEPMTAFYNKEAITLAPAYSVYKQYKITEQLIKSESLTDFEFLEFNSSQLSENHTLQYISTQYHPAGQALLFEITGTPLPEDHIIILRGSPQGFSHHRIIDLLPDKIKLYLLEYLEQHQPLIRHNDTSYAYILLYEPDRYSYFVGSLYSLNNHKPVGKPFAFNLGLD